MPELNPARAMVAILEASKSGNVPNGGGFGGGPHQQGGRFRSTFGLIGANAFKTIDAVVAMGNSLDWLYGAIEALPISGTRKGKYRDACDQVKAKLDWEFGDMAGPTRAEPSLNFDRMIVEFDHLADDLDDHFGKSVVDEEQIVEWENTIGLLYIEIVESELDPLIRHILLEVVSSLQAALRDLRRFGAASSESRLKDALGRIVSATVTIPTESKARTTLKMLMEVFVKIAGVVKAGQTMHEALPAIYKAIEGRIGQ